MSQTTQDTAGDHEEDEVEASKAPLIEHLIELRRRLMWSLVAIGVATLCCIVIAKPIYNILLWPYARAVGGYDEIQMIYTAPQEFFLTQLKLAFFGGIFISFPIIATQIYMFVAPGLYKNERKAFLPFLVATPILFVIGASVVYFIVMPLAMTFFLSMEQTAEGMAQIELLAQVSRYLNLIMTLIMAFGICFQMPVILTLLARVGIIGSDDLKKKRKHAIVIVFLMAAFLTPPDPFSQIGLAAPTLLLYEISILAVRYIERRRRQEEEAREAAAEAEAAT